MAAQSVLQQKIVRANVTIPDIFVNHRKTSIILNNMPKQDAFTLMKHASDRSDAFTLIELLVVIAILGILSTVGLGSFSSSQMKARDTKRKTNLAEITKSLELYNNDKGKYPLGSSGSIAGCGSTGTSPCNWGTDSFANPGTNTVYMVTLPTDPSSFKYYYVSTTGADYRLYAHLENVNDKSILPSPSYLTECGGVCNFGVSSPNVSP